MMKTQKKSRLHIWVGGKKVRGREDWNDIVTALVFSMGQRLAVGEQPPSLSKFCKVGT